MSTRGNEIEREKNSHRCVELSVCVRAYVCVCLTAYVVLPQNYHVRLRVCAYLCACMSACVRASEREPVSNS